jgi:hypothetical protein
MTSKSELPLSHYAPSVTPPAGCRHALAGRLWLLAVCLALWAGIGTARATITFTNYPSVVSNTYNGVITLQINGVTNGMNVVVQKFLDVNTNGIIDSRDLLVQQFRLTAGQASTFTNGSTIVTVTNFMPGDMSTTPGQIIAPLNFQNGDFMQTLAGQYLYKVSSPSGQFNPVTNLFVVTNTFFSSLITGQVENASTPQGTAVSNAVVLLFNNSGGELNVQAGAVANNSGYFAIRAPPGNYFLGGAKSNFVANLSQQGTFAIFTNTTNDVNVGLTPSTTNIIGKVVDAANSSLGLPGLVGIVQSTNGAYFSLYFTDTNGNFTAPVVSNQWTAPLSVFSAGFAGYLISETNLQLNVTNKAVRITNALPQETAIFYGTVTNSSGGPIPGLYLFDSDNADHQSLGLSDKNGNYVLGALGGTNVWQLLIPSTSNPALTNTYVFSPGYIQTSINTGQAIQENFTLKFAPYTISGSVSDVNGNPIGGVAVFATATNINGLNYQAFNAVTAANGTYSLNVCPGNWTVGLSTNSLASLGYDIFPADQSTNITDENATINFSVLLCGQIGILTTNLPDATEEIFYETNLEAISCYEIADWSTAYGITLTSLYGQTNIIYKPGTPIYSTAGLQGYLLSDFSYGLEKSGGSYYGYTSNCTANPPQYGNSTATFYNISATVNVSGPIASNTTVKIKGQTWTTTTPPSQQGNGIYQTTISQPGPVSYTIGDNPMAYSVTNGLLMTGPSSSKTNVVAYLKGNFPALVTGNSQNLPSTIPYTGTNSAVVWLKNGTNWGQYLISLYGPQTTNLPPSLSLVPSGSFTASLSGIPTSLGTNNGLFTFNVCAVDTASNAAIQTLTLLVNPAPITQPVLLPSGKILSPHVFELQIGGVAAGNNYTLLMSTNLASANWVPIFTTNASNTNTLVVPDSNATNPARFYRIEVNP